MLKPAERRAWIQMAGPLRMVIVVGGGPVGLLCANLLAMQGVPSLVLDHLESGEGAPDWLVLDGTVLRALQQLGLAPLLRFYDGLPMAEDAHDHAHRHAHAHHAHAHHAHEQQEEPVDEDLSPAQAAWVVVPPELQVVHELVIAGAGGQPQQRLAVPGHAGPTGHPQVAAVSRQSLVAALRSRLSFMPHVEVSTGMQVHRTIEDGRFIWLEGTERASSKCFRRRAFWVLACDGADSSLAAGVASRPVSGVPLPAYGAIDFEDGRLEQRRSSTTPRPAACVARIRHGKVILMGAARRQLSACGGQGLCASLRDAISVCWRLAYGLPGLLQMDALLESHAHERATETQALDGRLQALATGTPGALAALLSGPPPLPSGPLSCPGSGGFMLPQPRVCPQDGLVWSLDDLMGTGFSLLQRYDAPPPSGRLAMLMARLAPTLIRVSPSPTPSPQSPHAIWVWDREDALGELLRSGGGLLVRPDRYVWGSLKELAARQGDGTLW